jgi:hypothetical protein
VQPVIIPDQAMTMHDHTGLGRIMTDYTGLHAHGRQNGAAEGRPFPAGYARCFICIEIIGGGASARQTSLILPKQSTAINASRPVRACQRATRTRFHTSHGQKSGQTWLK